MGRLQDSSKAMKSDFQKFSGHLPDSTEVFEQKKFV